ncbi:hypothetical protein [Micromonospora sp. NPDC049102]|uniref:TRADD-N-associated membrane domain-containing protein n=1 Tax=Micromonospora sp. NPDC049102 TaxID=3364265 RepID=UPI003710CA8A
MGIDTADEWASIASATVGLVALVVVVLSLLQVSKGRVKFGPASVEFERDAKEIRDRLPLPEADPEDRQYALQREYHSRGLAQSGQSFWFSLIAAAVGFIVIIAALVAAALDTNQGLQIPALQVVSGTIIEAVSVLFFVQSNKARELMTSFFDKLREDRKFEESLVIAREMEEGITKQRLHAVLALAFSGSVDKEFIAMVVDASDQERHHPPAND